MPYIFTVADGSVPVYLDDIAAQLSQDIDKLPPGTPELLAHYKLPLPQQTSVLEVLVVVRGQELPHVHPSDLIFSVLAGGGYVELWDEMMDASVGTTVVIPKGVCHAYHNNQGTGVDSVLIATFSPADSSRADCPPRASQATKSRAAKKRSGGGKSPRRRRPAPAD